MEFYKITGNEDSAFINGLTKDVILQFASEEEIFSLVFGFKPEEYVFYTSPFREDDIAGAYFERFYYTKQKSKLYFKDWADPNRNLYDCFDAVQKFFSLPNFPETLQFIKANLLDGKPLIKREYKENDNFKEKSKTEIYCSTKALTETDKLFWKPYGISSKNLQEDKVFSVSRYFIKKENEDIRTLQVCYTPTYSYNEFKSGNKKLYSPYKTKKFLTNCTQNDIGGLLTLVESDTLIITKSYKDCRVLRNMGYNSIWLQNEGMIPSLDILIPIVKDFKYVVIFFDNDETGIRASEKLKNILMHNVDSSISTLHLPFYLLEKNIKDPSDMYKELGKETLKEFLNNNIV